MATKKKKVAPFQIRQGDVLVMAGKDDPRAKPLEREGGSVVLAHGEVTGHKHQIRAANVGHLKAEGAAYDLLRVTEGVEALLEHEEHATIVIPPGVHHVVRQREWSDEMARRVED